MLADANCNCAWSEPTLRPLALPMSAPHPHPPVPPEAEPVPPDADLGPLDERELAVVAALRAEERTAFQGLRRKLGLHQQALTRTLRRLERQGVVERDERGYALTASGQSAVKALVPVARTRSAELLPVLQALLPPTVTADDVAERLARRWFRDLRWYGRSDATPGEVALSWLTIDTGALVRVRFAHGMAVLEVELAPGERLDRFPAAQAVLKALAELYASGVPQQAA